MLRDQKRATKTLFTASKRTISELVFFPFRKKSLKKFFEKTLRKKYVYKLKKLQCFKMHVSSTWRAFLLSKNEHRVENIFFYKNLNEL